MLAGVPFPIASPALPSPSSSIIYVAIARICPEIHTRQSFNFLLPHRPFRVADQPESCQSARPRCHCRSWPLSASHSAMLTPVPLSVAGQQGSWGCRLLFRTAEADMGEEVSNGIGRLGLIDFSSHVLLRPNHHWLKYVCPYPLLINLIRKDKSVFISIFILNWQFPSMYQKNSHQTLNEPTTDYATWKCVAQGVVIY